MQAHEAIAGEHLWRVRYIYKRDLCMESSATADCGNAFFYAFTEEQASKKVAGWQYHLKGDGIIVESMEIVPLGSNLPFEPGLLQELPEQAVIVQMADDEVKL
jgi:hypothetical protein